MTRPCSDSRCGRSVRLRGCGWHVLLVDGLPLCTLLVGQGSHGVDAAALDQRLHAVGRRLLQKQHLEEVGERFGMHILLLDWHIAIDNVVKGHTVCDARPYLLVHLEARVELEHQGLGNGSMVGLRAIDGTGEAVVDPFELLLLRDRLLVDLFTRLRFVCSGRAVGRAEHLAAADAAKLVAVGEVDSEGIVVVHLRHDTVIHLAVQPYRSDWLADLDLRARRCIPIGRLAGSGGQVKHAQHGYQERGTRCW